MPAAPAEPRRRLIRERDTHRLVPTKYREKESVLARIADDVERSPRDLRPRTGHQRPAAGRASAAAGHRPARARLRGTVVPRRSTRRSATPIRRVRDSTVPSAGRGTPRSTCEPRKRRSRSIDRSNWRKSSGRPTRSPPTMTTSRTSAASSTTCGGTGASPTASLPTATSRHRRSASGSSTRLARRRLSERPPNGRHLPGLFPAGCRRQRAARRPVCLHVLARGVAVGEARGLVR